MTNSIWKTHSFLNIEKKKVLVLKLKPKTVKRNISKRLKSKRKSQQLLRKTRTSISKNLI